MCFSVFVDVLLCSSVALYPKKHSKQYISKHPGNTIYSTVNSQIVKMFEICCFDSNAALFAIQGGARRIELCNNRALDGITPVNSNGEIANVWNQAKSNSNPCNMQLMLRPLPNLDLQSRCLKAIEDIQSNSTDNSAGGQTASVPLLRLLAESSAFFATKFFSESDPVNDALHEVINSASELWPICDGFVLGFLRMRFGALHENKREITHPFFTVTESVRNLIGCSHSEYGTHWWLDVDWEFLTAFFASLSTQDLDSDEDLDTEITMKSVTFHRAIDCLFRQEELFLPGGIGENKCIVAHGYEKYTFLVSIIERLENFHMEFPASCDDVLNVKPLMSRAGMRFGRILTSGGPPRAMDGTNAILSVVSMLKGRKGAKTGLATEQKNPAASLPIMVGGSVNASTAESLLSELKDTFTGSGISLELHGSLLSGSASLPEPKELATVVGLSW